MTHGEKRKDLGADLEKNPSIECALERGLSWRSQRKNNVPGEYINIIQHIFTRTA